MLKTISISNFKVINDKPIELEVLKYVNYFVGQNGCGKSSILEMLSIIKYLKTESILKLEDEKYPYEIIKMDHIWDFDDRATDEESGYLKLTGLKGYTNNNPCALNLSINLVRNTLLCHPSHGNYIQISKGFAYSSDSANNNNPVDVVIQDTLLEYINLNLSDIPYISTQVISAKYFKKYKNIIKKFIPEFETALEKTHIVIDDLELSINQLSSGQQKILSLINQIFMRLFYSDPLKLIIILVDEPESNLHPEFQKKIPFVIKEILEVDFEEVRAQFFIATHSPFIISAAAQYPETQKVYLIEDGQTVDLEGNLGQGQNGYSGGECLLAVNKMLGANFQDLGMPTNYILVEESSKKTFLDTLFKKPEFNLNIEVICSNPNGDAGLIGFTENLKPLLSINQLFLGNIAFRDRYVVFTDYDKEYYDSMINLDKRNKNNGNNDHNKAFNLKKGLGDRFIAKKEELEQMYPKKLLPEKYQNWTGGSFKGYLKVNPLDEKNYGKIKSDLAVAVAEQMTKDQFKTFCPELYNLLF